MGKPSSVSSIDPRAFVAQVRATRDQRIEASISAWRTWMLTKLDRVLAMTDADIEKNSAVFAHIFPLGERSRSAPFAPVIGRAAMRAAIQADPMLRYAMVKAWRRMLLFYGLTLREGRIDWIGPRLWWARRASAHDRKISRMLRCVHGAGITEQSTMLMAFLSAECADIPTRAEAVQWWRSQLVE